MAVPGLRPDRVRHADELSRLAQAPLWHRARLEALAGAKSAAVTEIATIRAGTRHYSTACDGERSIAVVAVAPGLSNRIRRMNGRIRGTAANINASIQKSSA